MSSIMHIQHRIHKGVGFRFNTDRYTNLALRMHAESAAAHPKPAGFGAYPAGIGIGTVKVDYSNQQERFYLVQDAINDKYGKGTLVKAAMMNTVPGKTHFLERS